MFVLTWNHTRTGRPMRAVFDCMGGALVRVMFVRAVHPNHPMAVNGQPV